MSSAIKDLQLYLIPENHRPNLAAFTSNFISDLTKHEEHEPIMDRAVRELGARVTALVMPLIVSISAMQLAGATLCHMSLMALSGDWDGDLLYDYAEQTLKMIGAIFAQVIICPFSVIISPEVYQREVYISPPSEEENLIADLTNQLQSQANDHEVEIANMRGIIEQRERVIVRKDRQYLPLISLETFDRVKDQLNDLEGIALQRVHHQVEESAETWSPDQSTQLKISDAEKFVCPEGTLELRLDFSAESIREGLIDFLKKPHKFERLVIENSIDIEFLLSLGEDAETSLRGHLHTLVLSGERTSVDTLLELSEKFSISCFDLRNIQVEGDLNQLRESHIVFDPKGNQRRVRILSSNVQQQFDDLNEKLEQYVGSYSPQSGITNTLFSNNTDLKPFHPTAVFIRKVAFLRKAEFRVTDFVEVLRNVGKAFPKMKTLDLSECPNITVDIFEGLESISCEEILLYGSPETLLEQRLTNVGKAQVFETMVQHCQELVLAFNQFAGQKVADAQVVTLFEKVFDRRLSNRKIIQSVLEELRISNKTEDECRKLLEKVWSFRRMMGNRVSDGEIVTSIKEIFNLSNDNISEANSRRLTRNFMGVLPEGHRKDDYKIFKKATGSFIKGIVLLFLNGVERVRLDDLEGVEPLLHPAIKAVIQAENIKHRHKEVRITYYERETKSNKTFRGI